MFIIQSSSYKKVFAQSPYLYKEGMVLIIFYSKRKQIESDGLHPPSGIGKKALEHTTNLVHIE